MTKRIVTEDNPNTFLSCSEDGAQQSLDSCLIAGDIRHHDLRISHPCPASPRNCPPPLISYKPYNIELTTLTMTKANPMYLIVGGSHPHVFLHDRRMVGRDMQSEWGNISWNSETTTQVLPVSKFISDCSVSVDSRHTENLRPHDEAFISQPVNSPTQDQTNSSVPGPQIQSTCSTSTTPPPLKSNPTPVPKPLQKPIPQNPAPHAQNENDNPLEGRVKVENHLKEVSSRVEVPSIQEDNPLHFASRVFPPRQLALWLQCRPLLSHPNRLPRRSRRTH
jgi:hypothetical protein